MYHLPSMNTKTHTQDFTPLWLDSIEQIGRERWNALLDTPYPFLRHEFLYALEQSGCVGAGTGWQPQHLILLQADAPVAAVALYAKAHSYGEYVFDWAWADAYQRHGLAYYPKLISAVPFTPATGPRLLISEGVPRDQAVHALLKAIREKVQEEQLSSWHLLFPDQANLGALKDSGLIVRQGCQYHWFNQDYSDFDDFLSALSARKRKAIKRERRIVAEQDIQLKRLWGHEISPAQIEVFYHFYQATYYKRGQQGYLTLEFFERLLATMPEQLLLILATRQDEPVAAALCILGGDTLYGRYWGSFEDYPCLHFEACYYQGIEFCIEQKLARFDPGAQGEHKITRGFKPIPTHSLHWIAHPGFRTAIANFTAQEQEGVNHYLEKAQTLLPFKRSLSDRSA